MYSTVGVGRVYLGVCYAPNRVEREVNIGKTPDVQSSKDYGGVREHGGNRDWNVRRRKTFD